jgi:hypothetical protein
MRPEKPGAVDQKEQTAWLARAHDQGLVHGGLNRIKLVMGTQRTQHMRA